MRNCVVLQVSADTVSVFFFFFSLPFPQLEAAMALKLIPGLSLQLLVFGWV